MIKEIVIRGDRIHDIKTFYEEINDLFMKDVDWKLGESLDAFNDLLYGGYGLIQNNEPVNLIWTEFEKNRNDLGRAVTKTYYLNKLKHPTSFNTAWVEKKLEELEKGTGQTYFEILLEIIADHPNIHLIPR